MCYVSGRVSLGEVCGLPTLAAAIGQTGSLTALSDCLPWKKMKRLIHSRVSALGADRRRRVGQRLEFGVGNDPAGLVDVFAFPIFTFDFVTKAYRQGI